MDRTPAKPTFTARRFTMADLMILVAGCAAGIAWTQTYWADITRQMRSLGTSTLRESLQHLSEVSRPCLAMLGVALLICRIRRPRPALRRLARQPGSVALACASLSLAAEGAMLLVGWAATPGFNRLLAAPPTPGYTRVFPPREALLTYRIGYIGMTIAASWLVLVVSGRWRAEATWIDRAGLGLGACWIAEFVASGLKLYLQV